MRNGEIVTAGVLALFSIYLMWKSTELPIGYIEGRGPGGGPGPSGCRLIMLVSCGMIALNWWRRTSPPHPARRSRFSTPTAGGCWLLVGGGIIVLRGADRACSRCTAQSRSSCSTTCAYLGRHGWG
jgi:putative tricarboxylic transport membrane protein